MARILGLKLRTIERSLTNIYRKLGANAKSRHPRVHAVTLYLRALGMLPAADLAGAAET